MCERLPYEPYENEYIRAVWKKKELIMEGIHRFLTIPFGRSTYRILVPLNEEIANVHVNSPFHM